MTNEELSDALNQRLDSNGERLDSLEESAEITRNGVNVLIDWAEDCGNAIKFPLPGIANQIM